MRIKTFNAPYLNSSLRKAAVQTEKTIKRTVSKNLNLISILTISLHSDL